MTYRIGPAIYVALYMFEKLSLMKEEAIVVFVFVLNRNIFQYL
jgi:hypothetical protein